MGRPRKNPLPETTNMPDETVITVPERQEASTFETPISERGEEIPSQRGPVLEDPNAPADKWQRDSRGLLKSVEYVFNEDGTVNWLAMIPKKYFVINRQATAETDIDRVEDKHKLILLAGFKHLAFLRGYQCEPLPNIVAASPTYVAMSTTITWIPNYETDGYPVTRSGCADAWENNVSSKKAANGFTATNFLMTIAENRSFVRAVKNFLNISVLGQDEVNLTNEEPATASQPEPEGDAEARRILTKLLEDNKLPFEQFKNGIAHYVKKDMLKDLNADEWDLVDDIPSKRLFEITQFMRERFEERRNAPKK